MNTTGSLSVRLSACGTGAIQSSRLPSNNRNRFNYTFYWESRFLFLSFLGATVWRFFHPPPLPADRIHTFFPLLYCPLFQTTAFSFMVPTPSLFAGIFFFIPMLFQCLVIVLEDNFLLLLCHLLLKDAGCIILLLTVSVVHTSPPSVTLHLSTRLPWNLRYREPIRSRVSLL